jgi:hypothetical protein|tara:strand:- start:34837 stop:35418 length:582 start_codon:yes stop_codon:yes gene_type:complete
MALSKITTSSLADGAVSNIKVGAGIDSAKIGAGDVSNSEHAFLNSITSNIQTQLGNVGGGKVLQVINSSYSTQVNSVGDTGLTATITPSATSSKVLVFASQGCARAAWSTGGVVLILYRASTILVRFEENLALPGGGSAYQGIFTAASSTTYLDSPSSTSACVYKTTFGSTSGGMYAQYGGSTSTMTLVEIGA